MCRCLQRSVESLKDGDARGIASTSGPHRHDPRGEAERAQSGAAAGFSGRYILPSTTHIVLSMPLHMLPVPLDLHTVAWVNVMSSTLITHNSTWSSKEKNTQYSKHVCRTSSNGWHGGSDRHRRGRFPDSPRRHHRHSTSPDGRFRDRAAAAEAVRRRRAEAAAARSAQARSREAERQAETAATWARLRQSRAMRSLQQEVMPASCASVTCSVGFCRAGDCRTERSACISEVCPGSHG